MAWTPWSRRTRPTAKNAPIGNNPPEPLPAWAQTYIAFMDGELQRLEASLKDLAATVNR